MPRVRLPDGSIRNFPDEMSKAEIAAVLRKEFPAPQPGPLEPGERARRANGAEVSFNAVMARYVVLDSQGTPRGFRLTLDEAIDLADALPPPPAPRIKPKSQPETVQGIVTKHATIEQDIERHIRQSEGQARRAQRESIIQRPRRNRGTTRG
jgi:hypothetical protein